MLKYNLFFLKPILKFGCYYSGIAKIGAGEMSLWIKYLVVQEKPGLNQSTHMKGHNCL